MPTKRNHKIFRYSWVAVFVFLLIAVRAFEAQLFYDPFLAYFKNDYLNLRFPPYETWPLLGSMLFRYGLNSFFSIGIIYVFFPSKSLLQVTIGLYLFLGVLLLLALFALLTFSDHQSNFMLFYIRRLLIQPLFLLVFLPAFYFQHINSNS